MKLTDALALRDQGQHEQARTLLLRLVAEAPGDAEIQYETACVHDKLGLEAEAVPFYLAALAGSLPDDKLRRAYLGLGSTYRTLGRYVESERTLLEGLTRFPGAPELRAFLAMTWHNLGRSKAAVECLLELLAATSADEHVRTYERAIAFYAQDVDRTWGA